MSDLLNNYLQDLNYLIKENCNDVLINSEILNKIDKIYFQWQEIPYYSALGLVEAQLCAFDEENQLIGKIVPELGRKANL